MPMTKAAHCRNPLPSDVACKQRAEPVPPEPHRFMADVDPTLEHQVLDIPKAQRKPHEHHHHEPDDLG
jgi:hypothetical protein